MTEIPELKDAGQSKTSPFSPENIAKKQALKEKVTRLFTRKKESKPLEAQPQPEISSKKDPPKIEPIVDVEFNKSQPNIEQAAELKADYLGDFMESKVEKNTIILPEEQNSELQKKGQEHARKKKGSTPSLLKGDKTAAEYDIQVGNFSTRTGILHMDDGKRVFAVYNYDSSWIHRKLDGLSKRLSGDKMTKASSKEWKQLFEAKSNIPTIPNPDPNLVLMPYIPNVNAYDAIANNKTIENFGECDWAKTLSPGDKIVIGKSIIQELASLHGKNIAWGETILPNIILSKNQKPIIVDPEVSYGKNVPLEEQKARDLHDLLRSISGALNKSEGVTDESYNSVVKQLLDSYQDQKVITKLKEISAKKPSLVAKIYAPFYEPARLGISMKEAKKVDQAITSYQPQAA
jgi:tRNA A-37 threonylcarbamoyl transferase component Bud32